MTLTPSSMASWTAAAESDEKQPSSPQTLNISTFARGAMPEMMPRGMPKMLAATLPLPAAVDEVWVPWPSSSRADVNSSGRRPTTASYVAMKRSAPMSLLLHVNAGPGLAPPLNSQARDPSGAGVGAA